MRKQVAGSVHAVINHEVAVHMAAVVASADKQPDRPLSAFRGRLFCVDEDDVDEDVDVDVVVDVERMMMRMMRELSRAE